MLVFLIFYIFQKLAVEIFSFQDNIAAAVCNLIIIITLIRLLQYTTAKVEIKKCVWYSVTVKVLLYWELIVPCIICTMSSEQIPTGLIAVMLHASWSDIGHKSLQISRSFYVYTN